MEAEQLLEPAATRVRDPLTGRSVWLAGLLREARIDDGVLRFTLVVRKEHSPDDRQRMREAIVRNLVERGWEGEVACTLRVEGMTTGPVAAAPPPEPPRPDAVRGMSGPGVQPHGGPISKSPLPGVRHIVAVASGKGGVGKSTVACNLAVALARAGRRVGLMDADIYGPSLPLMMHVHGKPIAGPDRKILPLRAHGVECMSIGFLVDDREPIIWRGPMVMGVVNQFLKDVNWGELDYLIVDLPPGTGDAQLTMIQAVPISGGVIVTTPNAVALMDAVRGVEMFRKLEVPVLGIVENMAWYPLPGGGRTYPFGRDGGVRLAADYDVPLLAQVPLRDQIREAGDNGRPAVLDGETVFTTMAEAVGRALPV